MTDEELKKEAIKFAVDYPTSYGKGYKHKDLRIAYLAGAESREKRIVALDKENGKLEGKLADLQSEYIELENFHNNEVNELKAQIEELKKENVKLTKEYQTSRLYLDGYQDAEKHYLDMIDSQHKLVDEEKIKAKDIIQDLLSCCRNYPQKNIEKIKKAEQFLKGVSK